MVIVMQQGAPAEQVEAAIEASKSRASRRSSTLGWSGR